MKRELVFGNTLAGASCCGLLAYEIAHLSGYSFGQAVYKIDDYDEGVYLATGTLMAHGYALYSQIYSAQPPLLTFALSTVFRAFGAGPAQGRAAILFFGLLAIIATAVLASQAKGRLAGGIAAMLLVLSPVFLQYSHAVEEEVPMMALGAVSLALAIAWWKADATGTSSAVDAVPPSPHPLVVSQRLSSPPFPTVVIAALSGIFFGLAVMTKFFAFALLVPLAVIVGIRIADRLRASESPGPSVPIGHVAAFISGAAVPIALSFALWGGDEWRQMVGDRLSASTGQAAFQRESSFHLIRDLAGTDPGLTVLAVAGGILLLTGDWRLGLILDSWVLATIGVLLAYHPLFGHHVVILLAPAAVLAGVALASLAVSWLPDRGWLSGNSLGGAAFHSRMRMATKVLAGAAALAYLVFLPRLVTSYPTLLIPPSGTDRVLSSAGSIVRREALPSAFVAVGNAWICVDAARSCVPDLVDTSDVRVETGKLTAGEAISDTVRYHANVVALGRRLCLLPDYASWVRAHYTMLRAMPLEAADCPTGIYLRR